jgi:methionyl-tRNA synthetase
MSNSNNHILLTTAISYTNGSPHIGHLYEAILGDFIKRVYQIVDYDVKLLTGTDEHGKKIQTTAQDKGYNPIELCDKYSNEFKQMNISICSSYDYFIRTTESVHKEMVSKSVKSIINSDTNDSIYLGEYSGYYNVREECYITEIQAAQTDYKDPITSKPYEIVKEQTYYFILNKFVSTINETIETIKPSYFQDEINSRVSKGLDDLSITRTSFTWGIPFPSTNNHVIYVWFDALLNYITGKNILFPNKAHIKLNVKSIHLIGKDIIWFHSVIYPAILKACGYTDSIPYKILVHGFILDKDGRKMSKSSGNVISNEYLLNTYPIEAIRYYFITNTIMGQDFKFDSENLINNYNNMLIKGFGNLFQRLLKVIKPINNEINEWLNIYQNILINKQSECVSIVEKFLEWNGEFNIYQVYLNNLIDKLNKDLTEKKPWTQNVEIQVDILGNCIIEYYIIMCLMYPIIPNKTLELSKYFGWDKNLILNVKNIHITIQNEPSKPIAFEYIKDVLTNKQNNQNK